MGLLKILGLGKDKIVEEPKTKAPVKETADKKKNPHENGGCCGGCGSK